MDQKTKSFPGYLFPRPETAHTEERQLFAEFGSVGAVNILQDEKSLDVCCQRLRHSEHWDCFCACRPTLPLIKHNECVLGEPCMAEITDKKNRLMALCNLLKRKKGAIKVKQKLPAIRKVVKSLAKMYPDYFEEEPPDGLDGLDVSVDGEDDDSDDCDDDDDDDDNYDDETERGKEQKSGKRMFPKFDKISFLVKRLSDLVSLNLLKIPTQEESMFEEDALDLLINSKYTGGCLKCQMFGDDCGLVFCTRGPHMNHLYTLPVKVHNHQLTALDCDCCVNEHSEEICQIDSVCFQEEVFVVSRTASSCTMFKACHHQSGESLFGEGPESEDRKSPEITLLDTYSCTEQQLLNVALSPYIPGEVLVTCQNEGYGLVKLWSPGTGPELILNQLEPQFPVKYNWMQSYFASHPRNITVADRTGISLFDVRSSSSHSSHLMNLRECSLHLNERVMTSIRHPDQPFYHLVATDYSVLLLDERFPNHQVVQWYHTLLSHPQYLCLVPNVHISSGEQLLLVASQAVPETLAYPLNMNVGQPHPPCGAGTGWRTSRMDDFIHFATKQGAILSRNLADTPLIGMCALKHSADEGGLSVLQLSSTGNLFCQDYHFMSTCSGDKTWSFGIGSQNLHLSKDDNTYINKWLMDYETYLTTTCKVKFTADLSWVIEGMLNDQVLPHLCCTACPKQDSYQAAKVAGHAMVDDHSICYNCRIRLRQSEAIRNCSQKKMLTPKLQDEAARLPDHIRQLDLNSSEQFDYTSQIILKLWNDEDVMELVKQRDEEVTKTREEKFRRWKTEKLGESSTKESEVDSEEEGAGTDISLDASADLSTDQACLGAVDESPTQSDHFKSPLGSPHVSTSQKRRVSDRSPSSSSISSSSSRRSIDGFASIPSHLKKQSLEQLSSSLAASPVKKHHLSSPDHRGLSPSPVRSPMSSFASPQSSQRKQACVHSSPVTLFPTELLNRRSAKLLQHGTPHKKQKRPQVPGFL